MYKSNRCHVYLCLWIVFTRHQTEVNGEGLPEPKNKHLLLISTAEHFDNECDPGFNTSFPSSGVQLWKLEQRPNVGSMLLRLDFQTDVTPRLVFLKQLGVEDSRLGYLISHNPFILTESLENLQARYQS